MLHVAERVPPGCVITYGDVAGLLRPELGGGPRQVAAVMARDGGAVPWWRVVRSDGSLPDHLASEARSHYLAEGTPLSASGRVVVAAASWGP
ncbi:MAG TPA: MGMT family protein [Microthrixaceae bacterium]|nr:MGMT family protein [Microthrixaceae bacterium]